MATINDLKQLETPGTPLLLFDCTLPSGDVQRWSTHSVSLNGNVYAARILAHNLFDIRSSSDEATDGISRLSLTLANADAYLSPIERNIGWKGAELTATFVFFDLTAGAALSDSAIIFSGTASAPDESTESHLKLSFSNRLNLSRIQLPEIRIQKRCPWKFPATTQQRAEAVNGGDAGKWSPFYRCGYSPDQTNGVGNLDNGQPYTSCDYSRTQCTQRGMFALDNQNRPTRRFGGIEFVPPSIVVRSYGEQGSHFSATLDNQARYNDFVPLVYGTAWFLPELVFARNDGNLTHMELLLGGGEISEIVTVIVNSIEIPLAVTGKNMTSTGWYSLVTAGQRTGTFNRDFVDTAGNPVGDPYGSMAVLSVVVPNVVSDGQSAPNVIVLMQGIKLDRYDLNGGFVDTSFTNNPAWVMLDVLRRSGWASSQIDLISFAKAAQRCDELIPSVDLNGNATQITRYGCNLVLQSRRSAADVVRGIRNASALYIVFDALGRLQLCCEDTLAKQQPAQLPGSNSVQSLDGGWPAYEFGDNAFSGIARDSKGASTVRVYSRPSADCVNRYTVEFQDEFNEYQQDSLSLVDIDDEVLTGQEVSASLAALGLPNFDQASRAAALQLYKSVNGNTYIDFETSVRGVGLRPGDIITFTYGREGFTRQPFRIIRISPGLNHRRTRITAQIHDDTWYSAGAAANVSSGRQPQFQVGVPRPLVGSVLASDETSQFGLTETVTTATDGTISVTLSAAFITPAIPALSQAGVPLLSLNAQVDTEAGSLVGGQVLYYAVSAVDNWGNEGPLSFVVRANIPSATNSNRVTLSDLSFSSAATSFNVYRGPTPGELLCIAKQSSITNRFSDNGLTATLAGPPDFNFDHANFYWRAVLQPVQQADLASVKTIGKGILNMPINEYAGSVVRIISGTGAGQERAIASNSTTTLTVNSGFTIVPDATSAFVIAEATWHFGATSSFSPVSFNAPNQDGLIIQISGRAANVQNQECAYELSPLTDWRIGGSAGQGGDTDVPGIPTFGLLAAGGGTIEAVGLGFSSLTNTNSITAGTLNVAYWDELGGGTTLSLATSLTETSTSLALAGSSFQAGDLIQIEAEVVLIESVAADGTYTLTRGSHGSAAATHPALTPCYLLARKTFIMPFSTGFFGSAASGTYAYPMFLPNVRVAAAELFVTNTQGNSNVSRSSFTNTTDYGLRTLYGGQLTMQIEGLLAIQSNAVPPVLMDSTRSVRDVYAVVQNPSTAADIILEVTQNGSQLCQLTVPAGQTVSNVVNGSSLPPLASQARIGLNITSVAQSAGTSPGSGLTVTVRL